MLTVPAHSLFAPAVALLIAAALVIPGACGGLLSSSSGWTIRTPFVFQFGRLLGAGIAINLHSHGYPGPPVQRQTFLPNIIAGQQEWATPLEETTGLREGNG